MIESSALLERMEASCGIAGTDMKRKKYNTYRIMGQVCIAIIAEVSEKQIYRL